jgi:aspartyl-tRNA(Asn)/glutamyl-tRNA(Gln) amidotransferase subunit C
MAISTQEIKKLSELCRLEFSADEQEVLSSSLNEMVEYMAKLGELDLVNVEPMMRVDNSAKSLRQDEPHTSLSKEDAFKNAPSINMDHFSIPKTVG